MPIQNCSLLKSIKIISDDLENGNFLIDSRFASSVCRSVIEENGRDIIWGKAEQEIELVLRQHIRRILNRSIDIKNLRIFWEWDEENNKAEEVKPFRRSDYRAAFLQPAEVKNYDEINAQEELYYGKFCSIDSSQPEGSYLVCKKMPLADWDRLMVKISVKGLPVLEKMP